MTSDDSANAGTPRRATPADAATVAQLLHDFNTEFETPTPGTAELTSRLSLLLAGDDVVIDGEDIDARRFYEARGFSNTEPNGTEPMLYYYREL
ncbi:hypothetical protein [Arthrobacter sp. SPG23]|uniref:hypothetical protein n=1 Tax=Arthrobacter sp. SPG23 TaxID=1610703 RepID=UPI0009E24E8D